VIGVAVLAQTADLWTYAHMVRTPGAVELNPLVVGMGPDVAPWAKVALVVALVAITAVLALAEPKWRGIPRPEWKPTYLRIAACMLAAATVIGLIGAVSNMAAMA
jgi:hypothetical protein